jgi:hypothetical protein
VVDGSAEGSEGTGAEDMMKDTVTYQDTAPVEVDEVYDMTSDSEIETLPDTSYVSSLLPNTLSFEGGMAMS